MLFNSYAFIFLFLPFTLFGFFLLGRVSHKLAAGRMRHKKRLLVFAIAANLGVLACTFQLYFDFSGYSDMALAVAVNLNRYSEFLHFQF